jgi:hypothetical protein
MTNFKKNIFKFLYAICLLALCTYKENKSMQSKVHMPASNLFTLKNTTQSKIRIAGTKEFKGLDPVTNKIENTKDAVSLELSPNKSAHFLEKTSELDLSFTGAEGQDLGSIYIKVDVVDTTAQIYVKQSELMKPEAYINVRDLQAASMPNNAFTFDELSKLIFEIGEPFEGALKERAILISPIKKPAETKEKKEKKEEKSTEKQKE